MLKTYEETLDLLKEKGEVRIPLTDVDLQFFIEDSLDEENIVYQKLIPSRQRFSRSNSTKELIFKVFIE